MSEDTNANLRLSATSALLLSPETTRTYCIIIRVLLSTLKSDALIKYQNLIARSNSENYASLSRNNPFSNNINLKIAGPSLTAWRSEVALRGRTDVTQLEGVVVNKLEPGNT